MGQCLSSPLDGISPPGPTDSERPRRRTQRNAKMQEAKSFHKSSGNLSLTSVTSGPTGFDQIRDWTGVQILSPSDLLGGSVASLSASCPELFSRTPSSRAIPPDRNCVSQNFGSGPQQPSTRTQHLLEQYQMEQAKTWVPLRMRMPEHCEEESQEIQVDATQTAPPLAVNSAESNRDLSGQSKPKPMQQRLVSADQVLSLTMPSTANLTESLHPQWGDGSARSLGSGPQQPSVRTQRLLEQYQVEHEQAVMEESLRENNMESSAHRPSARTQRLLEQYQVEHGQLVMEESFSENTLLEQYQVEQAMEESSRECMMDSSHHSVRLSVQESDWVALSEEMRMLEQAMQESLIGVTPSVPTVPDHKELEDKPGSNSPPSLCPLSKLKPKERLINEDQILALTMPSTANLNLQFPQADASDLSLGSGPKQPSLQTQRLLEQYQVEHDQAVMDESLRDSSHHSTKHEVLQQALNQSFIDHSQGVDHNSGPEEIAELLGMVQEILQVIDEKKKTAYTGQNSHCCQEQMDEKKEIQRVRRLSSNVSSSLHGNDSGMARPNSIYQENKRNLEEVLHFVQQESPEPCNDLSEDSEDDLIMSIVQERASSALLEEEEPQAPALRESYAVELRQELQGLRMLRFSLSGIASPRNDTY